MSSAYDQARLIAHAAADERVGGIMRKQTYTTQSGKQTITARSTNQIVRTRRHRRGRRQDRLHQSLGLLPGDAAAVAPTGQQVAVVVLGAKSNASRFWETRHLFNWMSTRTKALLEGDAQHQQHE